jgi:hypothetical protein
MGGLPGVVFAGNIIEKGGCTECLRPKAVLYTDGIAQLHRSLCGVHVWVHTKLCAVHVSIGSPVRFLDPAHRPLADPVSLS